MKINFNFLKIKKITVIEISVVLIVLLAFGIYYFPRLLNKKEAMMAAKIKTDNAVFTSKALEEFSIDKKAKPSSVAQKVTSELNLINKNPFNKSSRAYTFDLECKGCNSVEYSDEQTMIILSTYDKKGDLIARTVIKPPSFVTYNKLDK